ncbi:MAG TPA: CoA pyrophosphatase [Bacteroidia bacterium]|nr:CoA pyrophosphatase [Bacteroidia bacterium]HNU33965.1 CoA pyrophosphatase [Bacteroidia bacterium]
MMQVNYKDFISDLKDKLKGTLPGEAAQYKLAPQYRGKINLNELTGHRTGSVMLFMFPEKNIPHILFIERADDGKVHSGQIAFPGGKYDLTDENFRHTALRETLEETGIEVSVTEVIGELTPLYIPPSNFLVYPFVAFKNYKPEFNPSTSEVKKIVSVSIPDLLHNNAISLNETHQTHRGEVIAPAYLIGNIKIWGATSMILSEFLSLIVD